MASKVAQLRLTKGGKAPATGKSTATGEAKLKMLSKTKGKWMPSTTTEPTLQHLADTDYLPQLEIVIPRSPVVGLMEGTFIVEVMPSQKHMSGLPSSLLFSMA